ncbi:hypothetical protein [Streptomyces sp. NPDC048659]|uniref:hypothetical protein n=1 Tax=Streptomyces sp. NPDC048659 TaxID=3155489 RepID=UPI003428B725
MGEAPEGEGVAAADGRPATASAATAGRRGLPKRERVGALAACVTGAVAMLVAGWLVAVPVSGAERAEAAFRRAPGCEAGPGVAPGPECVGRRDSVIDGIRTEGNKVREYVIGVKGRDGATDWIPLKHEYGFGSGAREGDAIALYSWRGEVRTVVVRDHAYATTATPVRSWDTALGWAVGIFPIGLAVLCSGAWWLARGAAHQAVGPWQPGLIGMAGILPGVFLGVWTLSGPETVGGALRTAGAGYAAAGVTVLLCWPFLARRERRRGVEIPFTPRPVADGQVLPVYLPYEPEYAGFTYLVVGPGRLAMSPDPTGRVARRPLPEGLRVLRVRRQLRTDPGPAISAGRSFSQYHIAECRAGERTLLFAGKLPELERLAGAIGPEASE